VNDRALRDFGKAAAHAILTFAMTTERVRPAPTAQAAAAAAAANVDYRGPHLVR
jgi:hypothetical protein